MQPLLLEWSDARTAAIYLKPCSARYLNEEFGHLLTRESANGPDARTARSGGWLYHRHDLERVRVIMDALGCKAARAAWLLHAIRELNQRDAFNYLLAKYNAVQDHRRRRFQ